MPTLNSGAFDVPPTELGKIVERVTNTSVLAGLSPEKPTQYGDVKAVRMSRKPRAQIVAEGAQKASDTAEWESVIASPIKFQTTVRMTDEVKWMDEDGRIQVVDDLIDALSESMARAVDLIGIHGINPQTGERAASVTSFLNQTTNRATGAGDPSAEIEAAVGAVMGESKYLPTGLALDGGYAFSLATQRYPDGRKMNPDMGFGAGVNSYAGLQVVSNTTVSGRPEAADTNLRALVGDYTQVQWGFQRRIPVEPIEFGDPDGGGDLKGNNQIAYRAEGVIYVAIFDLSAFAAVDGAAAPAG